MIKGWAGLIWPAPSQKAMNKRKILLLLLIALVSIIAGFLMFKNYNFYLVTTGSMEPAIPQGTIVIVESKDDLSVGDVITYEARKDVLITHRIVKKDLLGKEHLFYTKGDFNEDRDPMPVSTKNVIGKVIFSFPYLGYVLMFITSPVFLLFFFYVPSGYALGKLLKRFVNPPRP